jgi:hypothetical protein
MELNISNSAGCLNKAAVMKQPTTTLQDSSLKKPNLDIKKNTANIDI